VLKNILLIIGLSGDLQDFTTERNYNLFKRFTLIFKYFYKFYLGIKPDNQTWTSAFGTLAFNKQTRKTDFRSDQRDN